eukprot:scaffold4009_cov101-Isochrysis_galbana.AAC.1
MEVLSSSASAGVYQIKIDRSLPGCIVKSSMPECAPDAPSDAPLVSRAPSPSLLNAPKPRVVTPPLRASPRPPSPPLDKSPSSTSVSPEGLS